MTSLLFGMIVAALLSVTSLFMVLFRVSPLIAQKQAVTALLFSVLLSASTVSALIFVLVWKMLPWHAWDIGAILSISLREGIFVGLATAALLLFFLLSLLNWWIGILMYTMFLLIELALLSGRE